MITFVVPIKSTRFTKSEEALGVMVAECVSSCLSVIGSRVIVVCNPSFAKWVAPIAKASNKVDVIVLPETELPYGDEDKGEKMFAAAMRWLKYYEPTSEDHFMPVDCDDLIASDIWRVAFHGKSSVLNVGYL